MKTGSRSREGSLADIEGIRVGHATDRRALTGCTVILCEAGAVAGLDVRGGASGVRDPYVCRPDHLAPSLHAILLSGGSAFGLDAAAGVMRYLRERGIGVPTGVLPVPIVPAAILFDLGLGEPVIPDAGMAFEACEAAGTGAVPEGNVGAGTGASVGKFRGVRCATKSGLGNAGSVEGNVRVAALSVVNAFGDVVDPASGRILAGTRDSETGHHLIGTARHLEKGEEPGRWITNTTLTVLATNARLDRVKVNFLARCGQNVLSRVLRPAQTEYDGDLTFALSLGETEAPMIQLQLMAEKVIERSLLRAVLTAESAGGLPSAQEIRTKNL